MEVSPLVIKDLEAKVPIVQGGMGIGISLHKLAGAVAKEGGIGIISAAQIGFKEPDFDKDPFGANLRALKKELSMAREIAPEGVIGFNIMVAMNHYEDYVKEAAKAGADIIISGAGLPVDLPKYVEGYSTKIAPIVSSEKAAHIVLKFWDRKYKRTADMVVIEGAKAGGHLGFHFEELEVFDQKEYETEIKKIIALVRTYEKKFGVKIPVVLAGGMTDASDFENALSLVSFWRQIIPNNRKNFFQLFHFFKFYRSTGITFNTTFTFTSIEIANELFAQYIETYYYVVYLNHLNENI